MVLEKAREKYHSARLALWRWKERAVGRAAETRLRLASAVGSKDAKDRLETIGKLRQELKGQVIPARVIRSSKDEMEQYLAKAKERTARIARLEQWALQSDEIDEIQREMLADLIKHAKKDPEFAGRVLGMLEYAKEQREHLKKPAELIMGAQLQSRWRRFIGWKLLGPFKPKDIKEYYERYKQMRQQGMPLQAAGKYFAFYDNNKVATAYEQLLQNLRVITYRNTRNLPPKMLSKWGDPEKMARMADLLVKAAKVLRDEKIQQL